LSWRHATSATSSHFNEQSPRAECPLGRLLPLRRALGKLDQCRLGDPGLGTIARSAKCSSVAVLVAKSPGFRPLRFSCKISTRGELSPAGKTSLVCLSTQILGMDTLRLWRLQKARGHYRGGTAARIRYHGSDRLAGASWIWQQRQAQGSRVPT